MSEHKLVYKVDRPHSTECFIVWINDVQAFGEGKARVAERERQAKEDRLKNAEAEEEGEGEEEEDVGEAPEEEGGPKKNSKGRRYKKHNNEAGQDPDFGDLSKFLGNFEVYYSNQGAQGHLTVASKQLLASEFGEGLSTEEVIQQILRSPRSKLQDVDITKGQFTETNTNNRGAVSYGAQRGNAGGR